jgi:hypothetical protein
LPYGPKKTLWGGEPMRQLRSAFRNNQARLCSVWPPEWNTFGLILLVWVVAAAQWSMKDLVVPWDSKNQFYAFFRFLAEAIHEGSIPFWNPYHYGGHPSIADPQSLIFSPLFLMWAFLDPAPTLKAFDLVVYAHLLVGGLAIAKFGLKRGWTISACVLGASIFMFGGPASSRLNHVGIIIAYGLFPLCLLLMQNMIERPSLRSAILSGFGISLMILGRAQVPLMMASVVILYFFYELILIERVERKKQIIVFGCSLLVAFLIVIIPLALTIQFAEISNRPDSSLQIALRSSLNPINFATLLVPNIFGSLSIGPDWGPGYGNSPNSDSTDKTFNYLFCGTFSAIVFLWHLVSKGKIVDRYNLFFYLMVLLFTIYALGRYTPAYEFFYSYIPGVSKFRRSIDATFIVIAMLAYIVPTILVRLQKNGIPKLNLARLAFVSCCCIWIFGSAFQYSYSIGHTQDFIRELTKSAFLYLVIGSILILFSKRYMNQILTIAALLTSAELIAINAANKMNAEPQANYEILEQEGGTAKQILGLIRDDIDQTGRSPAFRPRVEIVGLGGQWQNAAMVLKLEATNGYNPLRIGAYDKLVSPGEVSYKFSRKFTKAFPNYHCSLAKKLGLEYLVLDRPIEELRRAEKVAHVLSSGPHIWIYRLESVQPRVSLNATYRVADFGKIISATEYPIKDDANITLVDSQPLFETLIPKKIGSTGKTQIISYAPDRIEIEVQSESAAVLTLHDIWYPGWKVYVDGLERRILKSDILFRGVRVEPADRKVVFRYEPLSLDNLKSIAARMLRID